MDKSPEYRFISNMWVMRRIEEDKLDSFVEKKRITLAEKEEIMKLDRVD